jgi:hypothetical protein
MFEQFTYAGYAQLLETVRDGRENLCFADLAASEPARYFILRHDIDFSLTSALRMGQIEAEHGLRATYFLLLSCRFYNLLAEDSCDAPRRLADLGHEIGLHYDVRAMAKRADGDLERNLRLEVDTLAALTGRPVRSIAMHNPSIYGDDPFAAHAGFINAYHPRFTKAIAYFSDSCGAWRDNAYHAFKSMQVPARLQLLIHPFLWDESAGNRWDRLDSWVKEKERELSDYREHVRQSWLAHPGVQEHEDRLTRGRT